MFVDRRRRDDPFLEWKVRLFSVAAVLVLLGLYLDNRWVTGLAIAVLAVAMLLRFLPGGSGRRESLHDAWEDGEEGDDLTGEGQRQDDGTTAVPTPEEGTPPEERATG